MSQSGRVGDAAKKRKISRQKQESWHHCNSDMSFPGGLAGKHMPATFSYSPAS